MKCLVCKKSQNYVYVILVQFIYLLMRQWKMSDQREWLVNQSVCD